MVAGINGASNSEANKKKTRDYDVASGKLTRSEYQILKDGLNWRKGSAHDKELIRLQQMYPTYFPKT
jgi:hypothetical protein